MIYYRCKCGKAESYGSMPPYPCDGCQECGTTLDIHPGAHRAPEPHRWETSSVDTDKGPAPVTRCTWCGKRRDPTEIALEQLERDTPASSQDD